MTMPRRFVAAIFAAGLAAGPVQAQLRVQQPTPPRPPGFQAPNIDPVMQKLNALQSEVNALRQSAGRQIVVLHYDTTPSTSWSDSDNSFPNNNQRAEAMCQEALGDRYGRVVSRKVAVSADLSRNYFPNLVCETKP